MGVSIKTRGYPCGCPIKRMDIPMDVHWYASMGVCIKTRRYPCGCPLKRMDIPEDVGSSDHGQV